MSHSQNHSVKVLYKIDHFGEILQNLAHSLENEDGKPKTTPLGGMLNEAPNEAKIHENVSFVDPAPNAIL